MPDTDEKVLGRGSGLEIGLGGDSRAPGVGGDVARTEDRDDTPDAVRDYLRSIGEHSLLTAEQEVGLGLAVERWLQLRALREQIRLEGYERVDPVELASSIYRSVLSRREMLSALAHAVGEENGDATVAELAAKGCVVS